MTDDDLVIMGSECGCLPIPEERIVKKWRLQPGKMFLVDLEKGRIIDDKELKDTLASAKPYAEWIERIRIKLDDLPAPARNAPGGGPLLDLQQAFGYTRKTSSSSWRPWALTAKSPSARWATTRRSQCCRTRTRRFITISSSSSRR